MSRLETSGDPHRTCAAVARWTAMIGRVSQCARGLRHSVRRHAAQYDLSDTQLMLLLACDRAPDDGISQSELATVLGVSTPQISGLVEQLQRRLLVCDKRSRDDRRRRHWRLSADGRELLAGAVGGLENWAGQLDSATSPDEQAVLASLLSRIAKSASDATRATTARTPAEGDDEQPRRAA